MAPSRNVQPGGGGARHATSVTPTTSPSGLGSRFADCALTIAPGLAAAVVVALVARQITGFLPAIVAEVTVAILIGIVVATVAGPRLVPLTPGLAFTSQRVLRLGIVLLGARLSLGEIARIGLPATGVVVITMAASFAIVLLVAWILRI